MVRAKMSGAVAVLSDAVACFAEQVLLKAMLTCRMSCDGAHGVRMGALALFNAQLRTVF